MPSFTPPPASRKSAGFVSENGGQDGRLSARKPVSSGRTVLDRLGAAYEVIPCDPALADTAAFCAHYGVAPSQSANTIVVASRKDPKVYAACLALATTKLDVNHKVSELLGVKKLSFA